MGLRFSLYSILIPHTADVNNASSVRAEEQNDGQSVERATTAVTPDQNINLFWLFLNRVSSSRSRNDMRSLCF